MGSLLLDKGYTFLELGDSLRPGPEPNLGLLTAALFSLPNVGIYTSLIR